MRQIMNWLVAIGLVSIPLAGADAASPPTRVEKKAPGYSAGSGIDAPEISRSRGMKGGVVVLWPRIIPAHEGAESQVLAREIQDRLVTMARAAFPGRPIDVRPSPERVCPMGGCEGIAVGALLMREENGCAVVALVSPPGTASMSLIPWAGDVRLRATRVPFRQPPENVVTITDFGLCDQMSDALGANERRVTNAFHKISP